MNPSSQQKSTQAGQLSCSQRATGRRTNRSGCPTGGLPFWSSHHPHAEQRPQPSQIIRSLPLEGHSRTASVVTGAGRAVVASAVSKAAARGQPRGKFVESESHHQPEGNRVLSVPRRVYFARGVRSSQRAIGSNIYRGPDMADEQVRSQRGDLGSPCLRSGSSWGPFLGRIRPF